MATIEMTCIECGKKNLFPSRKANAKFCNMDCWRNHKRKQFSAEAEAVGLTLIGDSKKRTYKLYECKECGTKKEIEFRRVRLNKFRCRVCEISNWSSEAEAHGLTFLEKGKPRYGIYLFNNCGHKAQIAYGDVRKGNFKCLECHENNLIHLANESGFDVDIPIKKGKILTLVCKECKTKKSHSKSELKRKNVRCQECINIKWRNEAKEHGLTFVKKGKTRAYKIYRFNDCGHQQEIHSGSIRNDYAVCHICDKNWRTLPSFVYLIRIDTPSFNWLKLGYSRIIRSRIKSYGLPNKAVPELIVKKRFLTGNDAQKFEEEVHKKLRKERLPKNKMKKFHKHSGFNECYPLEMLDTLMEELEST